MDKAAAETKKLVTRWLYQPDTTPYVYIVVGVGNSEFWRNATYIREIHRYDPSTLSRRTIVQSDGKFSEAPHRYFTAEEPFYYDIHAQRHLTKSVTVFKKYTHKKLIAELKRLITNSQ